MNKESHSYSGAERGGIKGSRKGIKYGTQGRNLNDTEHHKRMKHQMGEHPSFPAGGDDGNQGDPGDMSASY